MLADAAAIEEHGVDSAGQLGDFGRDGVAGGGTDPGSVGDGEIGHFAIDFYTPSSIFGSDLAVEFGGDAGDAGVLDAELVPTDAELFIARNSCQSRRSWAYETQRILATSSTRFAIARAYQRIFCLPHKRVWSG